MTKKALIVGINYPGTSHELRGCVNDALAMEKIARDRYGITDIVMLLDNQATTANIRAQLKWLVDGALPGDVLLFHYSGHGSQVVDMSSDESDYLDEIICPVDLDWNTKMITDDELKTIFNNVPAGVNMTVVLDCCNSGSGLDQEYQYQPLARSVPVNVKIRFLQPPAEMREKVAKLQQRNIKPVSRSVNDTVLLLSGCQAEQTSADAYLGGKFMGALTYYLTKTLEAANYNASYKLLVEEVNRQMVLNGFTQRPELNGPQPLFEQRFLVPFTTDPLPAEDFVMMDPVIDMQSGTVVDPQVEQNNSTTWIIIAVVFVAAVALFAVL